MIQILYPFSRTLKQRDGILYCFRLLLIFSPGFFFSIPGFFLCLPGLFGGCSGLILQLPGPVQLLFRFYVCSIFLRIPQAVSLICLINGCFHIRPGLISRCLRLFCLSIHGSFVRSSLFNGFAGVCFLPLPFTYCIFRIDPVLLRGIGILLSLPGFPRSVICFFLRFFYIGLRHCNGLLGCFQIFLGLLIFSLRILNILIRPFSVFFSCLHGLFRV